MRLRLPLKHLLTIASDGWDSRMRRIPEDRDETFAGEHCEASLLADGHPRPRTPWFLMPSRWAASAAYPSSPALPAGTAR